MFKIKEYEFKDDFVPCGLTVRLTKHFKAQTDLSLGLYERIYKEYGNMPEKELVEKANEIAEDDFVFGEQAQDILIDIVHQFINFYYPIGRDVISKGFTDKELIEAYDNIRAIGATKEKAKKKGLKR